jgi:hypothetical protein
MRADDVGVANRINGSDEFGNEPHTAQDGRTFCKAYALFSYEGIYTIQRDISI